MKRKILEYTLLGLGILGIVFTVINTKQAWMPASAAIFVPIAFFLAYLTVNVYLDYKKTGLKKTSSLIWSGCGAAGAVLCLLGFVLNWLKAT